MHKTANKNSVGDDLEIVVKPAANQVTLHEADWTLTIDAEIDQFDDILIVCCYQITDQ